jgi:hypothetical protein
VKAITRVGCKLIGFLKKWRLFSFNPKTLEGARLNVKEIAKEVDAPEAFTAKVLQILNKHRTLLP